MDEACRRVNQRKCHEGQVDAENMSPGKLRSIVRRMCRELEPPQIEEGFDCVMHCMSTTDTIDAVNRILQLQAGLQDVHDP